MIGNGRVKTEPKFHCWMNNGETEEDSWEHIASDHYMAAIRFAEEAAYDVGMEDEDEWKDENSVLVKDLDRNRKTLQHHTRV